MLPIYWEFWSLVLVSSFSTADKWQLPVIKEEFVQEELQHPGIKEEAEEVSIKKEEEDIIAVTALSVDEEKPDILLFHQCLKEETKGEHRDPEPGSSSSLDGHVGPGTVKYTVHKPVIKDSLYLGVINRPTSTSITTVKFKFKILCICLLTRDAPKLKLLSENEETKAENRNNKINCYANY